LKKSMLIVFLLFQGVELNGNTLPIYPETRVIHATPGFSLFNW